LPEALQAREIPNLRKAVADIALSRRKNDSWRCDCFDVGTMKFDIPDEIPVKKCAGS
jgi:hypothetical protein